MTIRRSLALTAGTAVLVLGAGTTAGAQTASGPLDVTTDLSGVSAACDPAGTSTLTFAVPDAVSGTVTFGAQSLEPVAASDLDSGSAGHRTGAVTAASLSVQGAPATASVPSDALGSCDSDGSDLYLRATVPVTTDAGQQVLSLRISAGVLRVSLPDSGTPSTPSGPTGTPGPSTPAPTDGSAPGQPDGTATPGQPGSTTPGTPGNAGPKPGKANKPTRRGVQFSYRVSWLGQQVSGDCLVTDGATTIDCRGVDAVKRTLSGLRITGPATVNGAATRYSIVVRDGDLLTGAPDRFSIRTSSGYRGGGTLKQGNVHVR